MDFKLRTRRFDDLSNWEIEQYLKDHDLIIVPVGNCETHAGLPVDCEGVAALGWAIKLAEKLDALYLPSLVYFNPGGTQIGRGTVHVSMEDSYRYTKAIAHSLLNQGVDHILIVDQFPETGAGALLRNQLFGQLHRAAHTKAEARALRHDQLSHGASSCSAARRCTTISQSS